MVLKEKNARIFLNNLKAVLETSLSLNLSDDKSTAVISSNFEQSYTCYGVSWEEYETLLTLLADENWCKISYLNGELKIVSPSENHEIAKVKIRALLETYCDYKGIDYRAFGSTTLKKKDMASGKQPDESYSFDISKSIPQLAIEIIFSSGSLEDLNKYEKLGVKEV